MPWSSFSLGRLLQGLPPILKSSLFPSEISLEKAKFSLVTRHQLGIASGIEMGVCVQFSFQP